MMSLTQSFHLFGDDPSTAKSVQLGEKQDLVALKKLLVNAFRIAGKQELGFQDSKQALETFEDVISSSGPVGITLDGGRVKKIDGPAGLPIVGNYYEYFPDTIGNRGRLFKKYGSIFKLTNMGQPIHFTNDPAIAMVAMAEGQYFTKKINSVHPLFTTKDNTALFIGDTETENWSLSHKFIPPSMSPKAVRHYTPKMQACVRQSFKVFDQLDEENISFNATPYMLKLASAFIGDVVLGMDFGQLESKDSPLHPLIEQIFSWLAVFQRVSTKGGWYASLPFGDPKSMRDNRAKLWAMLGEQVDVARQDIGPDLPLHDAALEAKSILDYLLRAVDKEGKKYPVELLYSNIVIVAVAGFLTTATLLSWLLYSMSVYPGVQDRLIQELVDHGINENTVWTPELSNSLPYLANFIKETQRLHNPAHQPARTSKEEVILPGGYRLPAEQCLVSSLYDLHTNPRVWENPQRFDPDRWDTEAVKNRPQGSYLPFATGPRGCIGFNLTLGEVKVLLPELVYRYEFLKDGDEPVQYDPEFLVIKPLNFYVRAKKRTHWPEPTAKA
jgi:cytochrome P450